MECPAVQPVFGPAVVRFVISKVIGEVLCGVMCRAIYGPNRMAVCRLFSSTRCPNITPQNGLGGSPLGILVKVVFLE